MKKLILAIFALVLTVTAVNAQSSGVKFNDGTYAEVLAAAKKADLPVFLDAYAVWCGPCKYMTSTIFPDKAAGDYFNKNFIPAKFDMEKGEGIELAKKFSIESYPTFLILDSEGKEITRLVGGSKTADDFIKRVKEAMEKVNKK